MLKGRTENVLSDLQFGLSAQDDNAAQACTTTRAVRLCLVVSAGQSGKVLMQPYPQHRMTLCRRGATLTT